MRSGDCARRAWGRSEHGGVIAALCIGAALALAGCTADGLSQVTNSLAARAPAPATPTVAFESVEGPPPAVFGRLVEHMSQEAQARRIAIVSRDGAAAYRIRGYMAATVERGRVRIGWVWDVYDAERRRSLRLSGEEAGAAARPSDAWQAADEAMVRRIARASMDRLVAFLGGSEPAPGPGLAPAGRPAVAQSSAPTTMALVAQ